MRSIYFWRKALQASRYNTLTACPDGGHILYNQISGALVVIDDKSRQQYDRFVAGDRIPYKFLSFLQDNGFAIPKGVDERDEIRRNWDAVTTSPAAKTLTIIPTDKCNLGCVYCYEDKADWKSMSQEVQEKVKKFATAYLRGTPTETFTVIWFGGEATLNMKAIENISAHLIEECRAIGVPYNAYLVTNGTTLNDYVLTRLEKCLISRCQVTVDGLKEDHDAKRPFLADMRIEDMNDAQIAQRRKIQPGFGTSLNIIGQSPVVRKPRSSFEEIMTNLRKMHARGFKVSLRVNVDHSNKEGVKKLREKLEQEGLLKEHPSGGNISFYSHPIFDGCGGRSKSYMTKAEHAEFECEINPLSTPRDMAYTGGTCTANKDFQFIINQRGGLVKCWHHGTDLSKQIATVDDLDVAVKGTGSIDTFKFNPLDDPECYDCSVLPICLGGCKTNNKFDTDGYKGTHEMGCHSARYSLPRNVVKIYQVAKNKNATSP